MPMRECRFAREAELGAANCAYDIGNGRCPGLVGIAPSSRLSSCSRASTLMTTPLGRVRRRGGLPMARLPSRRNVVAGIYRLGVHSIDGMVRLDVYAHVEHDGLHAGWREEDLCLARSAAEENVPTLEIP